MPEPGARDVNLVVPFLDTIDLAVRPSGPKEGVICTWGITEIGARELVSVGMGMRESKHGRSNRGGRVSTQSSDSPRHAWSWPMARPD